MKTIVELLEDETVPCVLCSADLLLDEIDEHYSLLHADEE